ncbi:UDP-glucuronosyltransferase 3A1-like [Conger conger]|uniref:UDP-glucuronosyltransferase 3A1-like n=1 Tax=Conger conger TaxID=82655 RepID=UPI002A5A0AED|nr:UDP-glucuronosyltransferase 3A1-like [Conger conger]
MSRLALVLFLLLDYPILQESAKILTLCLLGGSHYLLLDEVSHTFHQRGHEVQMLVQMGNPVIQGFEYVGRPNSYKITTWSTSESYIKEYNAWFLERQKDFLLGRDRFSDFLHFMGHLAYQCDLILSDTGLMDSLRRENFDLAILDAFMPCTFLLAHSLGLRYVAFYPGSLSGPLTVSLPRPLSYVPVFNSQLSDRMGFWGRVKNVAWGLVSPVAERQIQDQFREVGERHFATPPSLPELYSQAELWAFNTDFSLEFPQPLLPYTVCVGGMLSKPPAPVPQELEDFISDYSEVGFVVVTLGSMLSTVSQEHILQEMNAGFAGVPYGVIWRYDPSRWPPHLQPAPNIKLLKWLPQNDLLGHLKACLLVTHGGQNSLLQAVYHGVPVLGIPLFGDQFDNLVRAEVKGLGLVLKATELKREVLSSTIQRLIEDTRFKATATALSRIHQSQPLAPGPRLVHWVEHILHSGGGSHLRPRSLQQPWYQRWLLDVALFLALVLLGILGLGALAVRCVCRTQKLKVS